MPTDSLWGSAFFLVHPKYWKTLKLTSLSIKLIVVLNIGILFYNNKLSTESS